LSVCFKELGDLWLVSASVRALFALAWACSRNPALVCSAGHRAAPGVLFLKKQPRRRPKPRISAPPRRRPLYHHWFRRRISQTRYAVLGAGYYGLVLQMSLNVERHALAVS